MSNHSPQRSDAYAGTARLGSVVFAAFAGFFFVGILEYALPLYFNALEGFSKNVWAELVLWQVIPWIFTPALAGLLARRYSERRVWGAALFGQALVPLTLLIWPEPWIIRPLAFWNGFTGALMWVGGVSLIQIVPPHRKGLANGLMMMSMGVGSVLGPLAGRAILWSDSVASTLSVGSLRKLAEFLLNFTVPETDPPLRHFQWILFGLTVLAAASAVLIWFKGQRPGRFHGEDTAHDSAQAAADLRQLFHDPRFWALTLTLCVLGGPVFQATNQFLKYRAEDLGLIVGSQDRGWILLQLVRTVMWIPGGLAVGLVAGRRIPGSIAAAMLALFSLAGLGIGFAPSTGWLFVVVAMFEFVRQFMRWLHSGFLSEHLPQKLRATAIGCGISLAGIGSTVYGALPLEVMDPNSPHFNASIPFLIATAVGLAGAGALFLFDRFRPIRGACHE